MKCLILLSLILSTSALASSPCGKEGSIEERIKNCDFSKGNFALVARNDKGVEIYKDQKTGILWGDRISSDFNHFGSQKACSHDLAEADLLKDVKWRLPTVNEFEIAAAHEMKESLPRMQYYFWTSTPVKVKSKRRRRTIPSQAFLWSGPEEKTDVGDIKDAASVRCIGKG